MALFRCPLVYVESRAVQALFSTVLWAFPPQSGCQWGRSLKICLSFLVHPCREGSLSASLWAAGSKKCECKHSQVRSWADIKISVFKHKLLFPLPIWRNFSPFFLPMSQKSERGWVFFPHLSKFKHHNVRAEKKDKPEQRIVWVTAVSGGCLWECPCSFRAEFLDQADFYNSRGSSLCICVERRFLALKACYYEARLSLNAAWCQCRWNQQIVV